MSKKILWVSRHTPTLSQIQELKARYGEDVIVENFGRWVSSAEEIAERFRQGSYDDLVVVAPLFVLAHLCDLGCKPLWAQMVRGDPQKSEVVANGRGYSFVKFRRIKKVEIQFED